MLKHRLERFEALLTTGLLLVAGIGVAVFATAVAYSVFMRFALRAPQGWAEEFPNYVLVWTALLGAAVCVNRESHLTADVLSMITRSAVVHRVVRNVARVAMLGFVVVVAKAGWDLSQLTMAQLTSMLQISYGLVYLSVPVSFAAMALLIASRMLREIL